jgi:hypothetical protein
VSSDYRIFRGRSELHYIKHRMDAFHGYRETETVCSVAYFLFDREGA